MPSWREFNNWSVTSEWHTNFPVLTEMQEISTELRHTREEDSQVLTGMLFSHKVDPTTENNYPVYSQIMFLWRKAC